MKHRILISEWVAPETIAILEENNVLVKMGTGLEEKTIIEEIQDCDAVMVRMMSITKNVISNAPTLKIIAKHGVGFDSIDVKSADDAGIPVVFAPGSNSRSVAEHTMALILACARHLRETNIGYMNGDYNIKNGISFSEISGKTLSLIGFGNVARLVSQMAHFGFNMKVSIYDRCTISSDVPDYIHVCDDISSAFSEGDFISIHVSSTSDNKNLIKSDLLHKMKSTAFLVNTSRGFVVNSEDLIDAVECGIIAGAGLDVCNPEPAVVGSPFFNNPKFILTPHTAASSRESMVKMGAVAAQGVIDFFEGKTPKYIVVPGTLKH